MNNEQGGFTIAQRLEPEYAGVHEKRRARLEQERRWRKEMNRRRGADAEDAGQTRRWKA